MANEQNEKQPEVQFQILRVYLKDASLESPNSPQSFRLQEQPALKVEFNTQNSKVDNDVYEVVLSLTVTATIGKNENEHTVFLSEVKYGALFNVKTPSEEETKYLLETYCPSIVYPYAAECVSSQVVRASFPPVNLPPINFEAYAQAKAKQNAASSAEAAK